MAQKALKARKKAVPFRHYQRKTAGTEEGRRRGLDPRTVLLNRSSEPVRRQKRTSSREKKTRRPTKKALLKERIPREYGGSTKRKGKKIMRNAEGEEGNENRPAQREGRYKKKKTQLAGHIHPKESKNREFLERTTSPRATWRITTPIEKGDHGGLTREKKQRGCTPTQV